MERKIVCHERGAAWALMRSCEALGLAAGYPSLGAPYTVRVNVPEGSERALSAAMDRAGIVTRPAPATCVLCDDDGLDEAGRLCSVCGELATLLSDLEEAREAGLEDRVLRLEAALEGIRGAA